MLRNIPKRLVLGVIASLVFTPLVAIAPANATAADITPFTVTASEFQPADAATKDVAVQQTAGALNFVEFTASSDSTGDTTVVKVTGGTIILKTDSTGDAGTMNAALTEIVYAGPDLLGGAVGSKFRVGTPTVGTITVTVSTRVAASGVVTETLRQTFTITVNSATTVGVVSVAKSTSLLDTDDATAHNATGDVTVLRTATATNDVAGSIKLQLKDANDVNIVTSKNVTIKTTLGLVSAAAISGDVAAAAKGQDITVATTSGGLLFVNIYSGGVSGVGKVTLSIGTTEIASESFTLFGPVASYTVTTTKSVLAVGTTADVITVVALDANKVAIPNHGFYVYSGTAATATADASGTTTATGAADAVGATAVAKGTTLLTVGNAATLATSTITATATITVVAIGISSAALTFDKATYLPGEKATISLTLKNADAALIADGAYTAVMDANGVVPSSNLTVSMATADVTTKSGVASWTVYMPLTTGPVTLTAKLGAGAGNGVLAAAIAATTITGSATVATTPVPVVYDKPTLQVTKVDGKVLLSGTAVEGEGDIIVYLKKVGTTKWVEQAATIEVAAPGDFNGLRKAPKFNVLVRVKQEGTGLFSNQVVVRK